MDLIIVIRCWLLNESLSILDILDAMVRGILVEATLLVAQLYYGHVLCIGCTAIRGREG